MIEVVYLDRDNPNSVQFREDGELIDFNAAIRMSCELIGTGIIADSAQTPGVFDWTQGSGIVEFNFNDLDIFPGTYRAILAVHDDLHPDGQILTHPSGANLAFKFVE